MCQGGFFVEGCRVAGHLHGHRSLGSRGGRTRSDRSVCRSWHPSEEAAFVEAIGCVGNAVGEFSPM